MANKNSSFPQVPDPRLKGASEYNYPKDYVSLNQAGKLQEKLEKEKKKVTCPRCSKKVTKLTGSWSHLFGTEDVCINCDDGYAEVMKRHGIKPIQYKDTQESWYEDGEGVAEALGY